MPPQSAYATKSRFAVLNDMAGDDVESEEEEEVEQTYVGFCFQRPEASPTDLLAPVAVL